MKAFSPLIDPELIKWGWQIVSPYALSIKGGSCLQILQSSLTPELKHWVRIVNTRFTTAQESTLIRCGTCNLQHHQTISTGRRKTFFYT